MSVKPSVYCNANYFNSSMRVQISDGSEDVFRSSMLSAVNTSNAILLLIKANLEQLSISQTLGVRVGVVF